MSLMRTQRQRVAAAARQWVGTPYAHQGRELGVSCDCLGLIAAVGAECQVLSRDCRLATESDYSPNPDGVTLEAECDLTLVRRTGDPMPGMVGMFWYARRDFPQHLAIFSELRDGRLGMIHANGANAVVVEHALGEFWSRRLCGVFDFSGET